MAGVLTKATSRRRRGDVSRQGDNQFARKVRGRRRRDVSGSRGDVFSVAVTSPAVSKVGQAPSPQRLVSLLGLQQVSESPQSRTKLGPRRRRN